MITPSMLGLPTKIYARQLNLFTGTSGEFVKVMVLIKQESKTVPPSQTFKPIRKFRLERILCFTDILCLSYTQSCSKGDTLKEMNYLMYDESGSIDLGSYAACFCSLLSGKDGTTRLLKKSNLYNRDLMGWKVSRNSKSVCDSRPKHLHVQMGRELQHVKHTVLNSILFR